MPRTRELRAYPAIMLATSSLSATKSGMKSEDVANMIAGYALNSLEIMLATSSLSATKSGMKSVKPIAQLIMKMDGLVLIKFIIASLVLGLLKLRLSFWALSNFASLITSGFDGVSISLSK